MLNKSLKDNKFFWKNLFFKQINKKNAKANYLKYNLRFASIISPGSITNLRLMQLGSKAPQTHHNKLIVKQSYLLLTWLVYIQNQNSSKNSSTPAFFIQPKKQTKFTHLKAPMAHKTFSQEQFIFKHYIIVVSFKVLISELHTLKNINDILFLILSIRNSIPFFNTNLLFLKRINFSFLSSNKAFLRIF